MLSVIKKIIKKAFLKIGIEIHGFNPISSPVAQLTSSFHHFEIDLVLDVGANQGQFATGIREGGFKGKIISFEPLTSAFERLSRASQRDENWETYSRCAIGDQDGQTTINIAGNSASSSILPMLQSHISAAPHTAYIGQEAVSLLRLDSITPSYFKDYKKPFLKIDTQGFEWQVLDGCMKSLPQIQGVLVEMTLTPLYDSQRLWEDILLRMKNAGFTLWALQPGFTDLVNGRTYQVDGIFYRLP